MRNVPLETYPEYPEALKCKLSKKLLTDPVIDLETGESYDREAFHTLQEKFPEKKSAENIVLKKIVNDWLAILEELKKPEIRVPKDFTCPVSWLIYAEPVVLPQSGNSYEKIYIQLALSQQRCDPVTRKAVPEKPILVLNGNLQQIIAWCKNESPDFARKLAADWGALQEINQKAKIFSEQMLLEAAINIMAESRQIIANPSIAQVHRRCTYLQDALRVPIYSRPMEWCSVFRSNSYSKADLQEKFNRGVENLIHSRDVALLNTLMRILNIVQQTENSTVLEEKLRNQELAITSGFVAIFGMNREEILRFFLPRLGSPKMSDTHKNMKQYLGWVDSEVWLDEARAKIKHMLDQLNFMRSVQVTGAQHPSAVRP